MRQIALKCGATALVDEADFERISAHRWYLDTKGYAICNIRGRMIRMHRMVMNLGYGSAEARRPVVDHINKRKLDNRRANLRVCTQSQNCANSPARGGRTLKGVYWIGRDRTWECRFRQKYIGRFETSYDAACAYDDAAHAYYGAFAKLNFPSRHGVAQSVEDAGQDAGDVLGGHAA